MSQSGIVKLYNALDTNISMLIGPFGSHVLEFDACQIGITNLECEGLGFDRMNLLIAHCWEMYMPCVDVLEKIQDAYIRGNHLGGGHGDDGRGGIISIQIVTFFCVVRITGSTPVG